MDITEVRVKLLEGRSDRLRAFCSITIGEEFVVHDLRVIDGRKGLFVAMPSRKLSDNCTRCGGKNHLRARFCSDCGAKLDEGRALKGPKARDKFHVDVAHPINPACREQIQNAVLVAFEEELSLVVAGQEPARPYDPDQRSDEQDEYVPPADVVQEPDLEVAYSEEEPAPELLSVREEEAGFEPSTPTESGGLPDAEAAQGQPAPADEEEPEDDSPAGEEADGGFGDGIL